MQKTLRSLLLLGLLSGLTFTMACGEPVEEPLEQGNTTATNEDGDFPLSSLEALVSGAPENSTLRQEGKADANYPPTFFDLMELQSPVKSQGSRGVCSIFSAVALMEHLYIAEGTITNPDFSEQYLQWSAKFEVNSFPNTSGSNSNYNLQAISRFGIVEEQYWPYETQEWNTSNDEACGGEEKERPTRCFTNGEPPESAKNAQKFKLPSGRWISTRTRDIQAHMSTKKQGVLVGGPFYYQSWNHRASKLPTNQEYWRQGYVLFPNEADIAEGRERPAGHSILLVGWDSTLEVQTVDGDGKKVFDADGNPVMEKGFFIFKNSWGTGSFGVNNPHGDGYGFISMKYVDRYLSGYVSDLPTVEQPVAPICGETLDCSDPSCAGAAACDTGTGITETYVAETDAIIPDNDPNGLVSDLVVEEGGTITHLSIEPLIIHSYKGDLRIELTHPDGTTITLMEDDGNAGKIDETDENSLMFDVTAFNGKDAAGTWTLTVTDTARLDEGEMLGWFLYITR